MMVKMG